MQARSFFFFLLFSFLSKNTETGPQNKQTKRAAYYCQEVLEAIVP